jgi:NAD(P)-dependent dehydrogenase (short-subunit alcohol dehydrogenase family)
VSTVVVTGSTRGIGLGLAQALLLRGCDVVVCGRSQEAVDGALDRLGRASAPRVLGSCCDVTDPAQVQALWDVAVARFGRVDVWINNAGVTARSAPLWELAPTEVEAVVATNLTGTLHGCAVAVRGMLAQGGGHVYLMEGLGSRGEVRPGTVPYGTSKYAVRYLARALVRETRNTAVKVSTISPGMVRTELLLGSVAPERADRANRIFDILADDVETVAPWLADRILANTRSGRRIAWLTVPKVVWRFASSLWHRLDRD